MATIKVSKLPLDVTESDLKDLFSSYGFTEIKIKRIEDGNNQRIAYVQVEDEISEGVVKKLDGEQWRGRRLRVDKVRGQNGDRDPDEPNGDQEDEQPNGTENGDKNNGLSNDEQS